MTEMAVCSVSEVTRQIKELVEANFPRVAVLGEISNCTRAGSGHVYLTLKDENAQLRAVIWRGTASQLKFDLQDGLEVVAVGPVEVYRQRGSYQLIVEELVPKGVGALELAFRQLQQKLAAEGLFNPEHKQPLPALPRRIALITSPTSAAVRDMLQVITRRWPAVDLMIIPVAVQGAGAAEEIAVGFEQVVRIPGVDVVITGRGGGSLEDLWAFNEEVVARAIFACPIPVISAVGHEIDVTIADLVADRRALTPSEAGELVVPHRDEVTAALNLARQQMVAVLRRRAQRSRETLDQLASRRVFTRPTEYLVRELAARLDEWEQRMRRGVKHRLEFARSRVSAVSSSLDALSPLKVLQRGYTVTRKENGELVRSPGQLAPGECIQTEWPDGTAVSRVETITENSTPASDS